MGRGLNIKIGKIKKIEGVGATGIEDLGVGT
jgi:hypothetical protein